ncbi:Rrf2 family transcriptional regulator [Danxiaibacter flavus]|uniref:Rrf2 family transcriptional regulator n=1 Tax=Danxiaibacter flavus TaxID=3049108 RepID=A0ABV3ZM84_9BACT|nr:Rrf2 family transcriptional regulator [Chitinophagaceae bacterium DXS]
MLFSKTCEYGIRAAVYIASQHDKDYKIGITEICEKIEAPRHFTAKILQILTREGLVSSQKGVNGGFFMDEEQMNRPLIALVEAVEGTEALSRCGLGLRACSEKEPCPLHNKYKAIRTNIASMLTGITIGDMAKKLQKGSSFLKIA